MSVTLLLLLLIMLGILPLPIAAFLVSGLFLGVGAWMALTPAGF